MFFLNRYDDQSRDPAYRRNVSALVEAYWYSFQGDKEYAYQVLTEVALDVSKQHESLGNHGEVSR